MHQASWSRRWQRRSCWCEDHEIARARLMIDPIIGRNEVVVNWGNLAGDHPWAVQDHERHDTLPNLGYHPASQTLC